MKMNVIYDLSAAVYLMVLAAPTFMPYCNFATSVFSEMKVKSLRFQVNGRGTMSSMKTAISATSSANT